MADFDLPPSLPRSWSHSYWQNCWNRPNPTLDTSPDVLCFETGHYGLALNVANLTKTSYSKFDDDLSYTDVLKKENRVRMDSLTEGDLIVEVQVEGKTYRATTAKPRDPKNPHLCHARLWEAGRIAHHYELVGVVFKERGEDDGGGGGGGGGATLECSASIFIVAWPEEFAITLVVSAPADKIWEGLANVSLAFRDWSARQAFTGKRMQKNASVTLSCVVGNSGKRLEDGMRFWVNHEPPNEQKFYVAYNNHQACFIATIKDPKRGFAGGYTDIREHDKFRVDIVNSTNETAYVPFLFYVTSAANITGLVPSLWARKKDDDDDDDLVPTAIPVQLSKNWHYRPMGNYVRAYCLVPVRPGNNNYRFRIDYGFYGDLPSASHANLSLVGWPKYDVHSVAGRWEQLAIGCFGETFCIDADMSATSQAITDVRALMVRQGANGKKWGWTDAGWGGDWLNVRDERGAKLTFGGMKVAYLSQGPCITEVQYGGFYGSGQQVDLNATIRTVRSDDYARTFHILRYGFNTTVPFKNVTNTDGSCLFRVGGPAGWEGLVIPRIVLGNEDGLIEELEPPSTLKQGEYLIEKRSLIGSGPWWVGFPGSRFRKVQGKGTAWKALIIRSFQSNVGGEICSNPNVSLYARYKYDDDTFYFDAMLTPPLGVEEFNAGDSVAMDVEWITLPYNADDYYGANQAFRRHLEKNPDSWKTIHREMTENNLKVNVTGGKVKNNYPLIIQAIDSEISLAIAGGVGAVPIRFDGLSSRDFRLFDSSGGTDRFFEAGYDPQTFTFSISYNILLDDIATSTWTLKRI